MDWQERIVTDPAVLAGKPIVKGTRMSVEFVVGLLAKGWVEEDILVYYPSLSPEDIQACLAYGCQARAPQAGS